MRGQRSHALEGSRLGNDGLQRKPFVDDQRIVGVTRSRSRRAPCARSGTIVQRERVERAPCGRSCCRRVCILPPRASAIASRSPAAAKRSRQMLRNARRPALSASGR